MRDGERKLVTPVQLFLGENDKLIKTIAAAHSSIIKLSNESVLGLL